MQYFPFWNAYKGECCILISGSGGKKGAGQGMYRILLVDDEALIREAVSENVQWEKYGYELAGSCENGKEALD